MSLNRSETMANQKDLLLLGLKFWLTCMIPRRSFWATAPHPLGMLRFLRRQMYKKQTIFISWFQRYWYNHAYDTANSNVNFLYLSGEVRLNDSTADWKNGGSLLHNLLLHNFTYTNSDRSNVNTIVTLKPVTEMKKNPRNHIDRKFVQRQVRIEVCRLQQDGSLGFIVGLSQAPVYYAQQLNADLYTLEHRFYGKSHPTKWDGGRNLRIIFFYLRMIACESASDPRLFKLSLRC